MTPTSSIRFEKYGPAIIKKLGIRAMIGKTTMGPRDDGDDEGVRGCPSNRRRGHGEPSRQTGEKVLGVHFMEELGGPRRPG